MTIALPAHGANKSSTKLQQQRINVKLNQVAIALSEPAANPTDTTSEKSPTAKINDAASTKQPITEVNQVTTATSEPADNSTVATSEKPPIAEINGTVSTKQPITKEYQVVTAPSEPAYNPTDATSAKPPIAKMSQPVDTSEVAKRRGPRKKGKLNDATSALQPVAQVERLTTAPSEPKFKTKSKHQKRKVDDTTVVAKRRSPKKKVELIVEDNNHFGNSIAILLMQYQVMLGKMLSPTIKKLKVVAILMVTPFMFWR
jgi:hypothetical protein